MRNGTCSGNRAVAVGQLLLGVRFLPGYNPVFGDVWRNGAASEPSDSVFQIGFKMNACWKKSAERLIFYRQITAFLRSYMKIYKRVSPMEHSNLLVLHAANLLVGSAGSVTVEQLAEETGYTTRYIDKSFRSEVGLSPKQLAKIFRFQAAVKALNAHTDRNLTEIAMELGYYDQSHFVHDFKAFSGMTPKKYCSMLQNTQYFAKDANFRAEEKLAGISKKESVCAGSFFI